LLGFLRKLKMIVVVAIIAGLNYKESPNPGRNPF